MIYKKAIKEINTILEAEGTTAAGLFYRTGDQDGLMIQGPDEGLSESWIVVEVMLNMLRAEFANKNSAQTLINFLKKLGYFPTQAEAEIAYEKFLNSFPIPPTGKQRTKFN